MEGTGFSPYINLSRRNGLEPPRDVSSSPFAPLFTVFPQPPSSCRKGPGNNAALAGGRSPALKGHDFTGCGKTPCMEGTGFSPYINLSRRNGALAPEGRFLLALRPLFTVFPHVRRPDAEPGEAEGSALKLHRSRSTRLLGRTVLLKRRDGSAVASSYPRVETPFHPTDGIRPRPCQRAFAAEMNCQS